jgi:phage-related holin
MFKGYKTYIMAGVAVIGAVAAYLVGDLALSDAVQLVITAVLGATVRAGSKADADKVIAETKPE